MGTSGRETGAAAGAELPFPSVFAPPLRSAIPGALEALLDWILPPSCLHCGLAESRPGPWYPHLCPGCSAAVQGGANPVPLPGPTTVLAPLVHTGPARSLIHGLKYRGLERIGWRLGGVMGDLLEHWLDGVPPGWVVVPVPLHWRRRRQRGHDQTLALVRGLRRRIGWLDTAGALRRRRYTRPQVELDGPRRRKNPTGAFACRRAVRLRGRCVVLVDDVVTTGATLEAAVEALGCLRPARVIALAAATSPRNLPAASAPAPPPADRPEGGVRRGSRSSR